MSPLEILVGLVVSVGLPVLFFVCFGVALWQRGRCRWWVPAIATVPFALLTVIVPMAVASALAYGLFGLAVSAGLIRLGCWNRSQLALALVPLFVGFIVAAPAMAVVALSSLAGLPECSAERSSPRPSVSAGGAGSCEFKFVVQHLHRST